MSEVLLFLCPAVLSKRKRGTPIDDGLSAC
jgi:hypothetical protein